MNKTKGIHDKLYNGRRESGLCLWCGKPLDRAGSLCTECKNKGNERTKERRDYLLKRGICPVCGKRPVTQTLGRTYKSCEVCRRKSSERYKGQMLDQQSADRINAYRKSKREERREAGLCTTCGKREAEPGYRQCEVCRKKSREWKKTYITKGQLSNRALFYDNGLCSRCGRDELYADTKLCKRCYESSLESLEKARSVFLQHRADRRAEQEAKVLERSKFLHIQFKPRPLTDQRKERGDINGTDS